MIKGFSTRFASVACKCTTMWWLKWLTGIAVLVALNVSLYAELVLNTPDGTEIFPAGEFIRLQASDDGKDPASTPGTTVWTVTDGPSPGELLADGVAFPANNKSLIKLTATQDATPGTYTIKGKEAANREVVVVITVKDPFTVHEFQKVTVESQGILPNSAPTAVIGMNLADVTGNRKINGLSISISGGNIDTEGDDFDPQAHIENVCLYSDTGSGYFSYATDAAPAALATKQLDANGRCSFVTGDNIAIPADDKDGNAGNDFFITVETTATIPNGVYFRVYMTYTHLTENWKTFSDTIRCEARIIDMTPDAGEKSYPAFRKPGAMPELYHTSNIAKMWLSDCDGGMTSQPEIQIMDYPYRILGLDIAGSSGCVNSSGVIKDILNKVTVGFQDIDPGSSMFLSHMLDPWPDVSVWADSNNNGIFDPVHEGGGDRLVGPLKEPGGIATPHNGGNMRDLKISVEAVADGKVDFFICQATNPDHAWVTSTPIYGDTYKAAISWDGGIDFNYSSQAAGGTGIAAETKDIFSCMNTYSQPADSPEADGFPGPVFGFNFADGPRKAKNETVEWIKVYFKGGSYNGFKPTDLAPLSDDKYSGVSLWEDNKENMGKDQGGQFDIRSGITYVGEGRGSPKFGDINIPLSTDSLVWYNSDDTLWTPENDDPDHAGTKGDPKIYYVKLRPKTAWPFPSNDRNTDVTDEPNVINDDVLRRGADLFICTRGNGISTKSYSEDPWERGIDYGDKVEAYIHGSEDIMYGIRGHNTSSDQLPFSRSTPIATLPTFYKDLTRMLGGNKISPFKKTAVLGINMIAPLGSTTKLDQFGIMIFDVGEKNFAITDLINPYLVHPQQNNPDSGCGLAIYRDNPDAGINGVFDEHDIRVDMTAVPYPNPSGDVKQNHLQYVLPLVRDQAPIPTTDVGVHEGDDFFLIVQPTNGMDPGDDFNIVIYNAWFEKDGPRYSGTFADGGNISGRVYGKRVDTNRIINQVVNNSVLVNLYPAGNVVFPNSGQTTAVGIKVHDPLGNETLSGLRFYFDPQSELNPNDLLAPLDGTAKAGISVWKADGNQQVFLPAAAGTWKADWKDGYVHGIGEQKQLKASTVLNWFSKERVCWADKDKDGHWSDGDVLWINSVDPFSQTLITYEPGIDTPIVATDADVNITGVALNQGIWGFAYYDKNSDGKYEKGEDLYFLGKGRKTIGYYYDISLILPDSLPTVVDDKIDYYIKFATASSLTNYGEHKFAFHLERSGIKYSENHSFSNQNLTCSTVRMNVAPTIISDFAATRKEGYMLLNWSKPEGQDFYSVMITRCVDSSSTPTPPGAAEKPKEGISYKVGDIIGRSKVVYIGSAESFMDTGVVYNSYFYYQAFAGDSIDMVNAKPFPVKFVSDITPPMPITEYNEVRNAADVEMSWKHEDINDLAGILVLRREDDAEVSVPVDGQPYLVADAIGACTVIANITKAQSSLKTAYSSGSTSLVLVDATAFADPDGKFTAFVNIGSDVLGYSDINGNALTLTAAGTTDHNSGVTVSANLTRFTDTSLPAGYPHYTVHPYDLALNYGASSPYIKLITPVGYENWAAGMKHRIRWNNFGHVNGTVGIDLYKNGQWVMEIAGSTDNTSLENSYEWTIPATLEKATDYKVRIISNQNADISDTSRNNFEIAKAAISAEISAYKPSYSWGEIMSCQWTSNIGGSVNIELYNNGTLVKKVNDSPVENDNAISSYSFVLGADLQQGSNYSLKIVSVESSGLQAMTQTFAILKGAYIILDAPVDNEQITSGSSYTVKWNSNAGGKVNIYYSEESGGDGSWKLLKSGYSNVTHSDGETLTYSWDISTIVSGTNFRVKIESATEGSSLESKNLADFSIVPKITVTSPSAGDSWSAASSKNITWTAYGIGGNVTITLYKGSISKLVIDSGFDNTTNGSFSKSWNLADSIDQLEQADDYKIRISSVDNPTFYAESGVFSISKTAEITVVPDALSIKVALGDSNTGLVTLKNTGVASLQYTAQAMTESGGNWLSVIGNASGTLASGQEAEIKLNADASGLELRTYTGKLVVSDATGIAGPVTVAVTMQVMGHEIATNVDSLSFNANNGETSPEQILQLWNSGVGTMSYTVSADKSWVVLNGDVSGKSTADADENNKTVNVSCNAASLPSGTHTAVITVQDTEHSDVSKTVAVTFTVAIPVISVSATSLTAAIEEGETSPSSTFELWNSGYGNLNYAVTYEYADEHENPNWLKAITPSQGQVAAGEDNKTTVTVTYDIDSLDDGDYEATLYVKESVVAGVADKTINVRISVTKLLPKGGLQIKLTSDSNTFTRQSSNLVSFWQDQSGNSNDASQFQKNKQPAYLSAAIQKNAGLQFNAKSCMQISGLSDVPNDSSRTIALAFITDTDTEHGQILLAQGDKKMGINIHIEKQTLYANAWNFNSESWTSSISSPVTGGESYYLIMVMDTATGQLSGFLNETALTAANGVGSWEHPANISIGNFVKSTYTSTGTKAKGFLGAVCELLYYDFALEGDELTGARKYLKNKYCRSSQITIRNNDLTLWLRSDCGIKNELGYVKEWKNKADSTKKAVILKQGSKTKRPFVVDDAVNGYPAVRFDGISSCMMAKNGPGVNADKAGYYAKTVLIVFKTGDSVQNKQVVWAQGDKKAGMNIYLENGKVHMGGWSLKGKGATGWSQFINGGELQAGTVYCLRMLLDADNDIMQGFINGVMFDEQSSIGILVKHAPGALGAVLRTSIMDETSVKRGYYLAGDIIEVLMYNSVLTEEDISLIQTYMLDRYNISFSE